MKKVLVIVIAAILALSVVGTCFALYKINATDRNITLTTGDAVTLSLVGGDLAATGLSPNNATATYNVTLQSSSTVTDASKYGKFTVAISGDLASHISVSSTIDEVARDDAALKAGIHYALNDLPTTFTLTFTFNLGVADFSDLAEKVANVTLSWVIDDEYTGDYDADENAYYLVGDINGTEKWAPASNDHKFATENLSDVNNKAELVGVTLQAGDSVKILKGATWYGNWKNYTEIGTLDANGNLVVTAAGKYSFYLNTSDEIYVVKNS